MVLPVVLHNEVPGGQTEMVILHRFANLDDARVGYAKHIIEDLLRALARPWVPALLDVWKARGEAAQEFVGQVSAGLLPMHGRAPRYCPTGRHVSAGVRHDAAVQALCGHMR